MRLGVFVEPDAENADHERGTFTHCIVSRTIFEVRKKLVNDLFGFSAAMSSDELSTFENEVVAEFRDRVGARRAAQHQTHHAEQVSSDGQWHDVALNIELLPKDFSQLGSLVFLPIYDRQRQILLTVLAMKEETADKIDEAAVNSLQEAASIFLSDLTEKRRTYAALLDQHDALLERLEGHQMSQESKDLVSSLLLMPFLRKQTLKSIGEGIDALAERLVRYTSDDEDGEIVGQDIS